ncbi:CopG family transcriptional regulator [Novosphingobium sp. BW1]|uniref:CopG family transcriptional regulator n=1 Tax=Novosphingobium sp. BW1 TaxID=2592621 RepID=UPI0011DE694D|nr:CopG family transcriptional regulator [Novosphingobium sp. BW1]TYC79389.1 CopG family transcriptional regulator [Novosphingobium sp. BW1]
MRKPHVKQTFRIDPRLSRLLEDHARARNVTRTDVVEAALASLLSPDHEERIEAILTRRLDRMSRQLDRLEWHVELTNETLALFIRFWLTNNPPLPDAALRAGQATGKKRWQAFVESLSRRMEAGPKLREELSRDMG